MDNFVEYLDNYKKRKYINYFDIYNIINATNYHYYYNSLYETSFNGLPYSPFEYKSPVRTNEYPKKKLPPASKKSRSTNDFSGCFNSSMTMTMTDYEIINCLLDSKTPYEEWQFKHEVLVKPIDTKNEKNEKGENEYVKHVYIQVSIENLSDLIKLIDDNPYFPNIKYNIDLEALHKIRGELVEINNMIGMDTLKTSILNQLIYFIQELDKGNADFKHTVICGPPGTGKTEIAKLIGTMYSKVGILKKNVFKKVTRNDLVAGYLGQTAIKTKKVIEECLGGCLFIDEAYSLAPPDDIDSYSKECIDIICEALSDHKDKLMVIIAGYEQELYNTFFRANRGLESRFIWKFKIEEYKPNELMMIFTKKVKEAGWDFDDEKTLKVDWFKNKKDDFKYFGRDMELLFSHIKVVHSRRIYGKPPELRKKISLEDIDKGYKVFVENLKKKEEKPVLYGLYV